MTLAAPVISRSNNSVDWDISFYTPASLYPTLASVPAPTAKNMEIDAFPQGGILFASAGFGGFATAAEFKKTATQLRADLQRDGRNIVGDSAFTEVWAQYDSPYVLFVSVSVSASRDCDYNFALSLCRTDTMKCGSRSRCKKTAALLLHWFSPVTCCDMLEYTRLVCMRTWSLVFTTCPLALMIY